MMRSIILVPLLLACFTSTYCSNADGKPDETVNDVQEFTKKFLNKDGSVNYDSLYDGPTEETDGKKSYVFMHMIPQINPKVLMDKTKSSMPTYMLEARTSLEIFSDNFAHPEEFVKIADIKDKKARMMQVLKWYLSSFHIARRNPIGSAPMPCIMGEIFQCYYDVPGLPETSEKVGDDGPVPWATKNQLTYVAEKVERQPNVMGYYVEHYNKKITFYSTLKLAVSPEWDASIEIKDVGEGIIHILEDDEKYKLTFPARRLRGALLVPYFELDGKTHIVCEKTGYGAEIEFFLKPLFRKPNIKNTIKAEVFAPDQETPFVTITGRWNATMNAKWEDGKEETFVDVTTLPIAYKHVRPIIEQEPNESRKVWKDVAKAIRFNEGKEVTNLRGEIVKHEQMAAKEREKNQVEWETKLFKKSNEGMIYQYQYIRPLSERLKPV